MLLWFKPQRGKKWVVVCLLIARGRRGAVEAAAGREEVGGIESRLEVDP